jgi:hypothetical protein
MGELDPSRLGFRQMQKILKMLVHHIDHSVAQRPQKKKGAHQAKNPQMIPSVTPFKKPALIRSARIRVFSVHNRLA